MVIDGDMETFDARVAAAEGAVAGSADAGARETAQFLDVEVEEIAGMRVFVADRGSFGRFERRKAIEVMTAQDAGQGGLGNWQDHHDLGVGAALAAEVENLGFELGAGLTRLVMRDRRAIRQASGKAAFFGAPEPAAHGAIRDAVSKSSGAQRHGFGRKKSGHFGSHQRGESGISVHVVRAGLREVEFSSTTSLPDLSRADNVLKHHT